MSFKIIFISGKMDVLYKQGPLYVTPIGLVNLWFITDYTVLIWALLILCDQDINYIIYLCEPYDLWKLQTMYNDYVTWSATKISLELCLFGTNIDWALYWDIIYIMHLSVTVYVKPNLSACFDLFCPGPTNAMGDQNRSLNLCLFVCLCVCNVIICLYFQYHSHIKSKKQDQVFWCKWLFCDNLKFKKKIRVSLALCRKHVSFLLV